MPDAMNLLSDEAGTILGSLLEHLSRHEAREVIDGIDESRRLGIEERMGKEEVGSRNVGLVRRRPPTDLEMLRMAFERLHQRLIVVPALARSLQRYLGAREMVWRVDREFVLEDRLPALEAKIDDLLPDGIENVLMAYEQVRELIPDIVPPGKAERA